MRALSAMVYVHCHLSGRETSQGHNGVKQDITQYTLICYSRDATIILQYIILYIIFLYFCLLLGEGVHYLFKHRIISPCAKQFVIFEFNPT